MYIFFITLILDLFVLQFLGEGLGLYYNGKQSSWQSWKHGSMYFEKNYHYMKTTQELRRNGRNSGGYHRPK